MLSQLPQIEVTIRNLAFGAGGVGEVVSQSNGKTDLLGIAAFVPFSIPGEKVLAQVIEQKKKHLLAKLIEVLEPAPSRISPLCPSFATCGGCELQHMHYENQLLEKQRMIRGSLLAASIPPEIVDKLKPIQRSDPFGYRRRITLHVDSSGNLGFYKVNSRVVVTINHCDISNSEINRDLPAVKQLVLESKGLISSVTIENDDRGNIIVLKSPYSLSPGQIQRIEQAARPAFSNVLIMAQGKEVGGFGRQILQLPLLQQSRLFFQSTESDRGRYTPNSRSTSELELNVPAGYFSQVNWGINLTLIEKVVAACKAQRHQTILDLYSGAGNFSLPLARTGALVTAVESDDRLTTLAKDNVRKTGLERNLKVISSSVEQFLRTPEGRSNYDLIVADPPRSGLGSLIHHLPQTKSLIYISCALPSFIRDLKTLVSKNWQINFIEPHDMFAQTSYVEILCVATANSK